MPDISGLGGNFALTNAGTAAAQRREPDEEFEVIDALDLKEVKLGRQGENNTQNVQIDCSDWLTDLPGCQLMVVARRPGESELYVPQISVAAGVVTWPILSQDTALAGWGRAEVRGLLNGKIKKSCVFRTRIEPSLDGDGSPNPPTPPDWATEVINSVETSEGLVEQAEELVEQATATAIYAVRYDTAQGLTEAQKATARGNAGAASDDDLIELENTVSIALAGKVDVAQGAAQAGKAMIVGADGNITTGGAVRFDAEQDLTDAQKVQARSNAGAAGVAELNINILPYPYSHATETVNGITYTDNGDGTITASGTATTTGTHVIAGWEIANGSVPLIEGNAYLLSGCPAGGDVGKYFIGCRVYENGVTPGPSTGTVLRDTGDGVSFHGYKYVSIYLAVIAGTTVSNLVFRPMLRQASISADAYAPYGESLFGGGGSSENPELDAFNAEYDVNLLDEFVITNTTTNGLTFTVPGDGTVHVSGTASKATTVGVATFSVPEDGTYKFNGQQVNNLLKNSVYVIIFDKTANTMLVEMKNVTATATCLASHVYAYRLYFANGTNCGSDLVFMPMVHSNDILPPFQPRYGDNALAAYVAEADDRMNDRSECYMPDYSDMLDQTGGKLPYKIRGRSLTVYAPTSTPTDTTGSLIFGDMSGLREGEWYDLSFDYFNTSTKAVYLTFIAGKGMNTNYASVKSIPIPASSQGTMNITTYQHRFQYKHFRLYYGDFSSGSSCTIANLKIYKKSMLADGAAKDAANPEDDVMNPVYGAGMTSSAADPTVILADNMYYAYHTGGNIAMLRSPDLVEWERCGGIFGSDSVTAIKAVVGVDSIGMWAPNIIRRGDGYLMYFNAVENNNTANNCHMMVARAAHPGGPWVYAGEIFNATSIGVRDCIDADVVCTPANELYMFFGSTYGMYVCKLTDNGLALDTSFEKVLIHTHSSGTSTKLEGAMLHFRQQANVGWYYYLITSCGDYAKTGGYHLTVSRSTSLTGPYLDKSGNSIVTASNVGTNLLTGSKELLSPGHCSGIFTDKAGRSYILCHAYRSMDTYRSLCLVEMHWGDDGWPYVGETTEISTAAERPRV